MATLIRFFADYSPLVYFLLALGAILAGRRIWRIWSENRDAIFDLEHEMLQQRLVQSISTLILIVFLGVGELMLDTIVAPSLPASALLSTPTLNPLSTPAGTTAPDLAIQPTGLPYSTQAGQGSGCLTGQVMISSPGEGQTIKGQIQVTGTANIPGFGFYKYEVALRNTDNWTTILAGREPKVNDDLGAWNTTELDPGDYLLRLVVTDNTGSAWPPCVISVRITGE